MKKGVSSILLFCLLSLLVTSGCAAKSGGANSSGNFRIGVLLPLSGANAHEGEVCKNAMQFAADKINSAGGIKSLGGEKLEI